MRTRQWLSFAALTSSVLALVSVAAQPQPFVVLRAASSAVEGQDQVREFTVVGDHYAFSPSTLTVNKGDVVKITFTARDIAHSFTIDGPYRISKRAAAGQSVTFEFRADTEGPHPIYCNLTADPKCKEMKGTLQVNVR